jgi:sugar/nucleoside kinase (ribokinase family)
MDILGIGNALMDVFWFSEDESALSLGLHPNRAAHVSADRLDELLLAVPEPISVAGGSASNALKVASALGWQTAFIGCTGTEDDESDACAKSFRSELTSYGVETLTESRKGATGRCLVIHMPGGLKSVACAPSAATGIRADQVTDELVARARIALVDGPILANEVLISRISSLCRTHGIPLALDGGSPDLVRNHRDRITSLLSANKMILLFNSDEALAFARGFTGDYGAVFPRLALSGDAYPCIVQKKGAHGAEAWSAGTRAEDAGTPMECVLDDTGAGDVFNGAFLSAWLRNAPLAETLSFANETARCALDVPGTNLDRDRLRELRSRLDSIAREQTARD